nr:uncharacterized protein LOC110375008 [Helicoverpa armigera]
MKPLLQGDTITNNSCSCTSCVSKSESNGQALRRLLQEGSRINKLINGKNYVRIQDSKLLDEFLKTRALYEALRSQLLSSSLSVSSKAHLQPTQSTSAHQDPEKNVDTDNLLALVDLVDKGAVLKSRKLSECCSCCACNSKTRLPENAQKVRRNRQAHIGVHITSRSSLASKQENSDAKNIKSDSCTCACKDYEQTNLVSREKFNKIHLEPPITKPERPTGLNKSKLKSMNDGKMKSYHKLKRSKANPNTYNENISESNKIRKSKQKSRDDMKNLDLLDLAQKIIKDSFIAEQKAKQKHTPQENPVAAITAGSSRNDKNPVKDNNGSLEINKSPLIQIPEHRIKKISKSRNKTKDPSNTSATHIRKDKNKPEPEATVSEQQKNLSQKRSKNNFLYDTQVDDKNLVKDKNGSREINKSPIIQSTAHRTKKISKSRNKTKDPSSISSTYIRKDKNNPEPEATISEQQKNLSQKHSKNNLLYVDDKKKKRKGHRIVQETSETKKAPSHKKISFKSVTTLLSPADVSGKPEKQLTFSSSQAKEIKTHAIRSPSKISKSISTSSIKKSYSPYNKNSQPRQTLSNKSSLNSLSKENKIKVVSPVSFHRQLKLLSAPIRYGKSAVPKDPPKIQQTDDHRKTLKRVKSPPRDVSHDPERSVQPKTSRHREESPSCDVFCQREKSSQRKKFRQDKGSSQRKKSRQPEESQKLDEPKRSPTRLEQVKPTQLEKSRPGQKSKQREVICKCEKPGTHIQSPQQKESRLSDKSSSRKKSVLLRPPRLPWGSRFSDRMLPSHYKKHQVKQKQIMKNIQAGGHALKRCLCSLKIKVKKTKSRINENDRKEIPKTKISQSIHSKDSPSSVKSSLKASHSTIHKSEPPSICECSDYASKSKSQEILNKKIPENIQKSEHSLHNKRSTLSAQTDSHSKIKKSTPTRSKGSDISSKSSKRKGTSTYELSQSTKHTRSNSSIHKEAKEGSPDRNSSISTLKPKSALKNSYSITKEKQRLKNHAAQTATDTVSNKQKTKVLPSRATSKGMKVLSFEHRAKNWHYTSTHRFSIELFGNGYSKKGHRNNQITLKPVHTNNTRTKRIRNKGSQISNSTGKVRYPKRNHGLRRCFCRSKLLENKKKIKGNSSKMNMIQPESKAESSQTKLKIKTVSISTERQMYGNVIKHVILPYKCETTFRGPLQYNRTKSYKITHTSPKREEQKLIKHVKAECRKPKSDYSITSQSLQFKKNKVPSIVSHKSEILKPILKKNKAISPDITRQDIKSSFLKSPLHRDRKSHSYSAAEKESKIKKNSDQPYSKDSALNDNKTLESFSQDRSLFLGPTVKHCLCKLKLHKTGKNNRQSIAVNTDTLSNSVADKKYPATKLKLSNQLTQSDSKYPKPYEGLQKTKKRTKLKSFGVGTEKTKTVSKSSETRTVGSNNHIRSNFRIRKISLPKFKNMRKYSGLADWSAHTGEINPNWNQNIKINSNLSFNINIYEDAAPDNKTQQHISNNMTHGILKNDYDSKNIVHRVSDNFKSLLKIKSPKTSGCICTLELGKKGEQHRGSKLLSPFLTKKPNQVYKVNTVTIAETKIIAPKIFTPKDVDDYRSVNSSDHTNNSKQALDHNNQREYCERKLTTGFSTSTFAVTSRNIKSCMRENESATLQVNPINVNSLKFSSKEIVTIKSKFSCELNYVKNECVKSDRIHSNTLYTNKTFELNDLASETTIAEDINVKKEIPIQIEHIDRNHLTGVQPLLKRCYCTMNIQVAGQHNTKRRHHHSSRLKDYECEPGVCVPYECDPYECQKRIMRRLMKKVSTMSGTDNRLRNSASGTSSMRSDSRTRGLQPSLVHKERRRRPEPRPMGFRYQTLPRTHRQAVKYGSSFNFDIEFSKRSKSPTPKVMKVPRRSRSSITSYRHYIDRGTRGFGGERRHRGSQSTLRHMRHRGSGVSMLRRCFCTLKLQKKGRQQRELELKNIHRGTSTPPKYEVDKPILRTTETGQNTKTRQRYPELLPYECEPGICVPGECDPYECLELIKRRKGKRTRNFGTDSIASGTSSSSSMTPSHKRRGRQVQSRNVRVRPIKSTEVISKPSVVSLGRHVTPSRQAVKISSNFSFNIEFYKDKTSPGEVRESPQSNVYNKTPRYVRGVPKYVNTRRMMREGYSQDVKPTRDFYSQMDTRTRGQSTMTSRFLKRCFCTAKLLGYNHETRSRHYKSYPILKRCFCTLKMLYANKRDYRQPDNVGHERAPPIIDRHVVMTQTRRYSPYLLPYECEPGVCVPGYCDPYQCEKLIRRRRMRERMIGTEGPRTRSVSSGFASSRTSKAGMTQSRSPWPPEHFRRRDYSEREMVIKERVTAPVSPQRQAVKFGSNFSFDIEFYKDKFPNHHQIQAATTFQRPRPRRRRDHGVYHGYRTRDMGTRGRGVSVQSRDSQVFAPRRKDMGIGPILRRCFCTLQLYRQKQSQKNEQLKTNMKKSDNDKQDQSKKGKQKQPKTKKQKQSKTGKQKQSKKDKQNQAKKDKQKKSKKDCLCKKDESANQGTATPVFRYKLEPYECEPGVCVPGECDPYECEKRIRNRRMYSSGTLTEHYRTRSTSNMTNYRRRHRYSNAQFVPKRRKPMRTHDVYYRTKPKYNRVVERPSKEAVKIGSNFNIDIEFFKEKSPAGGLVRSMPVKQYTTYDKHRRRGTTSRSTEWRSTPSRNNWVQRSRAMRDMDSQAFGRKMRSTITGAGPFLKRCFCTLQLHKSENKTKHFGNASVSTATEKVKPKQRQSPHSNSVEKSTHTKKQKSKKDCLCKKDESANQGTATPVFHYKLEPYECEPGVCVPGECDPYECEKKIKRRLWSKQSGTEPYRTRSVSSAVGRRAEYRPGQTQASSYTPHQMAPRTHHDDEYVRDENRVIYNSSSNRKAVRISSSFSFSVEFYKDTSPKFPSISDANIIYMRKMKGTETRSTRTRSMASYYERIGPRHCQSQTDCIKSHCKASCTPSPRRCFCTLKLQKMGKDQQYISYEPYTYLTGTHTQTKNLMEIIPVAREIGTKTKKYRHILEPYECEPGVCVPGLCDPYECVKRIMRRNFKHFGTGTDGFSTRSISSLTPRYVRDNAMSQSCEDKCDKKITPSTETVYENRRPYRTEVVEDHDRQALCLGSNFSFNMEFFKDTTVKSGEYDYEYETRRRYKIYNNNPVKYKSRVCASTCDGIKSRNRGTYGRGYVDHRTSQAGVDTESRGSGVGPLLKRCFCTLTLQRAEVTTKFNSPATMSNKKTSTKKKFTPVPEPTYYLEPDECEPGVCVPGECNPYECLERIKRRGIRRYSRTTGTRMRRPQVSVSNMTQCIPGYTCKKIQCKEEPCTPKKIERIIEEPRFPFLHRGIKQGVRISSRFNINIEFYKEPLCPIITEEPICPKKAICRTKDRCIECNREWKTTKTGSYGTKKCLHDCEAQCALVKTADKCSAVAMLRRCFCTAKLQRSHLARTYHPQSYTVGRMEQISPTPLFGPREYWVQYQTPNNIKKSFKTKGYTLETIMSPRKSCNNKRCCIGHECTFRRVQSPMDRTFKSEGFRKGSEVKPSNFKKILFSCKHLFRKRSNQICFNNSDKKEPDQPEVKKKPINRQPWIDILKPSKSERRPKTTGIPTIKKSKSLKVTEEGQLNIHKNFFSRFQSGDADQENNNRIQKTTARNVKPNCPHCQAQVQRVNKTLNKKVRFASLLNYKTSKALIPMPIKQSNNLKPISFLFKSRTFDVCSCCGALRKTRFLPPVSRGELLNNKSYENVTIRKSDITKGITPVPAKISTFKENTGPPKGTRKRPKQYCPCCVCKKQKTSNNRNRNHIGNKKDALAKTWVCGSVVCKEAIKDAEYKHLAPRRNERKTRDGTRICASKSNKEAHATDSGYEPFRLQRKNQARQEKEAQMRKQLYKAEDTVLMRMRNTKDKYMYKKIPKYKNAPDALPFTETVPDICKLGITSASDKLRGARRALVFGSKRTYRSIQAFLRDPMRAWKKNQVAAGTRPRVASRECLNLRCQVMKCVKGDREKLEDRSVKKILVHAHGTDPMKRVHTRKQHPAWRRKLVFAYGCSRFMLSLREQPWLTEYYKRAWLYTHSHSVLEVWRRFMDISLFLLAVPVCSPCIFCAQLSRALMYCFLCKR